MKVPVWLFLLLIWLGIMFLGLALPSPSVELEVCKEGNKTDSIEIDGKNFKNSIWVEPSSVSNITELADKECSAIKVSPGRIIVKGTVKQVWCKLYGGPACEASH